jgi:hypothetical protein
MITKSWKVETVEYDYMENEKLSGILSSVSLLLSTAFLPSQTPLEHTPRRGIIK